MNKRDIIQLIKNVESNINKKIFKDDSRSKNDTSNNQIGCGQFRELAAICRNAECYDEVELLVRYNEAKVSKGTSWNCLMIDNKNTFADIIVSCMKEIKAKSGADSCLKDLSLFFGYFYWHSRIWAAEYKAQSDNKTIYNSSKKGNYSEKNNFKKSYRK